MAMENSVESSPPPNSGRSDLTPERNLPKKTEISAALKRWQDQFERRIDEWTALFLSGQEDQAFSLAGEEIKKVDNQERLDWAAHIIHTRLYKDSYIPDEPIPPEKEKSDRFLHQTEVLLYNHCFSLGDPGRMFICGKLIQDLQERLGMTYEIRRLVLFKLKELGPQIREKIRDCQDYQTALEIARPVFLAFLRNQHLSEREE